MPANVSLSPNHYSWNRVANVLYLDSPCGTGFSYGESAGDYAFNDETAVGDMQSFLTAWLTEYTAFRNSSLFLTGTL